MIKSLNLILVVFPVLFLCFGCLSFCVNAAESAGKLILKKMDLPASTSNWNNRIPNLGDDRPALSTEKESLSYWFFLPKDESAKSSEGYPLLLFLHGAGERGSDPEIVKVHGPLNLIENGAANHWKFITVAPQCPSGKYWSPDQLLALLDELVLQYPIDQNRIYLTGLSMGGFATWMLLDKDPDRFAAAVPICGGGLLKHPERLKDLPIRVFHGDADTVVNAQFSRDLVDQIQKAGGKKIELTLYKNVGHNSWTQTYADPKLYDWLLQQNKKSR